MGIAAALFAGVLAVGTTPGVPVPTGAVELLMAQAHRAEGDLSAALAALSGAVDRQPEDPYLRIERARLLFELGRLEEASAEVARGLAAAPEELDAVRLQGRIELARAAEEPQAAERARAAFETLRRADPNDIESLVALAQLHLAAGRAELAAEVLEEALRLRPGNAWLDSLRAHALAALGDGEAAERLQRTALAREPSNLSARFEIAERLGRVGRNAEAAALLEQAPAIQASRPELRERLARQLHLAGASERAFAIASVLAAERPDSLEAARLTARIGVALGRFSTAESALVPFLRNPLEDVQVEELYLRALEGQGKRAEAVRWLEAKRVGLARSGDQRAATEVALELARLHAQGGDYEAAYELTRLVAASDDPELADSGLRWSVRTLLDLGRASEALELVQSNDIERPALFGLRLVALLGAERELDARRESERLLAAWPGSELPIAAIFQEQGRDELALPLFERALLRDPDSLEARFRLAALYERRGNAEMAIPLLRELVAKAPRFATALNFLGYLWIERAENLAEAVSLVREAVRIEPDNGAFVDSLGWGLFRQGRFEDAAGMLERAARLMPNDETILEHLGDARAATGDLVGALAAYEHALKVAPEKSAELRQKIERLHGDS